jgi:acyl-CoA reductase-like NAD-dependent aldehyde dehydrogenase
VAAAENITPVLLELGGQNPALVDATANIPDAAKKIVWGAMAWGGQWCTSPGYAYVHESVAEVFGPVLPILTYETLDEALGRIAGTPKPLAAFVFSRDQKVIDRFIGELSYGGGAVNQVNIHLFIESMPFGGTGQSGMGHYYGKHGFDALTRAKSMLISPPDSAIGHLFPPYTDAKNAELEQWLDY